MITVSKEDYLKAVAEAESEGDTVISATLAHWLSVTRPAVTAALKRLKKDGMVAVKSDGRIQLTTQGRQVAEQIIFRHHLIERMLSEIFGMPWYAVHEEAERLEHAVSPAFEKKLIEKLGENDVCPHGNSLSLRSPAERRKKGYRLLGEARMGFNTGSRAFTKEIASSWSSSKARGSAPALASSSKAATMTAPSR
jgi:DtxR family transcriptional regulator, Mn-dependent transcriptional regulator